ncbi:hypothetical protein MY3957_008269 [Beauveria namnaoensis]
MAPAPPNVVSAGDGSRRDASVRPNSNRFAPLATENQGADDPFADAEVLIAEAQDQLDTRASILCAASRNTYEQPSFNTGRLPPVNASHAPPPEKASTFAGIARAAHETQPGNRKIAPKAAPGRPRAPRNDKRVLIRLQKDSTIFDKGLQIQLAIRDRLHLQLADVLNIKPTNTGFALLLRTAEIQQKILQNQQQWGLLIGLEIAEKDTEWYTYLTKNFLRTITSWDGTELDYKSTVEEAIKELGFTQSNGEALTRVALAHTVQDPQNVLPSQNAQHMAAEHSLRLNRAMPSSKAKLHYRALWRTTESFSGQETQHARICFKRTVRRVQRDFWSVVIADITAPDDVYKVTRWLKPRQRISPPPIQVGEQIFSTNEDKARALGQAKLERRTAGDDIADPWSYPVATKTSTPFDHTISYEEARFGLLSTGNTSPGVDGITVNMLQELWPTIGHLVTDIYNACLQQGYCSSAWRTAEVVMIPKPNKRNLTDPSAWRPISLLSCLIAAMEEWGQQEGFAFDVKKTEVIHFASRRRNNLPPIQHQDQTIKPNPAMRWLGVWFDARLYFTIHMMKWAQKAKSVIYHLRSMSNTIRGISAAVARRAAWAVVMPTLFYGVDVWFPGSERVPKGHLEIIQKTLTVACRMILPSWRTTPKTTLWKEAGIPPAELLLQQIAARNAIGILLAYQCEASYDRKLQSMAGATAGPNCVMINLFR